MSIAKLLRYTSFVFLLLVWSVFAETAWTQPLCVSNLQTNLQTSGILLSWTSSGTDHYNVYRSTVSGGPYSFIGSTPLTSFLDAGPFTPDQTYYYVVRPATVLDTEICQSNEVHQIFQIISITPVPTMTEWGMFILTVFLGIGSVYYLRRRGSVV